MAHERRVRAAVRRPREATSGAGEGTSAPSSPDASNDDEWVDSDRGTSSSTSTNTSHSKQGRSEGSTHPRHANNDFEEGQEVEVVAPPLDNGEFESWEDLENFLETYTKQTYQSFRVRTNNTAAARNVKIRASSSTQPLIPEEWKYYGKTFVCTHSGKYKARGKGKRKRLQSRAMECGAQVCFVSDWAHLGVIWVQLDQCLRPSKGCLGSYVCLRVTTARLVHNHSLNKHSFNQYPHIRNALEPEVVSTVNELRKAGAKKKNILKYIHDKSKCSPSPQDVHNLVRRLKKKEETADTTAKRLKQYMVDFSEEPGNVGRIFVDDVGAKKIATCITMQTKHMRQMFDKFPEVLMIDATHGTNASKYKVFSIMTHYIFGKGQFVQHAVVQNERRSTLLTALEEFKRNNPAWQRIQCILIDKDFTEMSVLKKAFPDARLLLCQFHVIKYLREEISSSDYGFSSWQKQQLQGLVNMLVYARTEREYLKYRNYMRHIMNIGRGGTSRQGVVSGADTGRDELGDDCDELGGGTNEVGAGRGELGSGSGDEVNEEPTHPFEVYFKKNWDSCRPMWCAFERENAVTMGNNTNNRIECRCCPIGYTNKNNVLCTD